ncbi:MAG TPA: hypothetical protein VIE44_20030 [Methylomirabilota bacterium]|jgi:hypothetical protein
MARHVRRLSPFLRSGQGRSRLAGLAMAGCLVAGLLGVSPAAAAHPPGARLSATAGTDSSSTGSESTETPPVTPGAAALVCAGVLALPGALAARRSRRVGVVAAAALLVWFAGETAIHSAHHLSSPSEAKHCPLFWAAQHLPGLDPEPSGHVLHRPAPAAFLSPPPPAVSAPVVLDGEPARAPPALPA